LCWSYLEVGFEANTPGNALFAHLHMHFLFCGRLLLRQQFVLRHNWSITQSSCLLLICACVFVLWKLLLCQQFVLRHNGILHNHHARPFAHAFLFRGSCCFANNLCYSIMEYYTIIMPPPTRNSVLKVQRGFPQSLICHRMSSKFQKAYSQLIIHSVC